MASKSKEKREERQKKRQDKEERAVCLGTHSLFRLGFHNSLGFRDRPFFCVVFLFLSLFSRGFLLREATTNGTNDDDDDIIIDRFETDASHIIISSPLLGRQIRSFEKTKKKKKKEYEHTNALVALRLSLSLSFFLRSVGRGRL